jgi:hypothetical protein
MRIGEFKKRLPKSLLCRQVLVELIDVSDAAALEQSAATAIVIPAVADGRLRDIGRAAEREQGPVERARHERIFFAVGRERRHSNSHPLHVA